MISYALVERMDKNELAPRALTRRFGDNDEYYL